MSNYTLLIADDEAIECAGIAGLVQEGFPQIRVLPSVHSSLELIWSARKYHPDIILADINMPGMSGLEALELLQKEGIHAKIIINTAYSYFSYAKKAVSLGAVDYLVKPMDREAFGQIMEKIIWELEQEKLKNKQEEMDKLAFQKMLEVAGKAVISSVILGRPNTEELTIWLENMGHTYWGGFFVAAKLWEKEVQKKTQRENYFSDRRERLLCRIQEISEPILKLESPLLSKRYNGMILWFFFPEEGIGSDNYQSWVSASLNRLSEEVQNNCGAVLQFGVSGWHYDYEEMHYAYLEAVTAVNSAADGEVVLFKPLGRMGKNLRMAEQNVEQLAAYASAHDLENCRAFLYLQMQIWQGCGLNQIEYMVLLTRLMQECSRRVCGYTLYSWGQLRAAAVQAKDLEELADMMVSLLDGLSVLEDKGNTRIAYVCRSLRYIEEHFTENISLDMTAENLGISSFYLSRILTQILQTSFVELLTGARINHAVEQIAAQDAMTRNLLQKSGYQSAAYFYKVFKKTTGMTVGEMRDFYRNAGDGNV